MHNKTKDSFYFTTGSLLIKGHFMIFFIILLWYLFLYICYHFINIDVMKYLSLDYQKKQSINETKNLLTNQDKNNNHLMLLGTFSILKKTLLINVITASFFFFNKLVSQSLYLDYNLYSVLVYIMIFIISISYFFLLKNIFFFKTNLSIVTMHLDDKLRIYAVIRNILLGNISEDSRLMYILISDSLCSFSRSIVELFCVAWILFFPMSNYSFVLESIVLLYPTFIRFKQCLFEYRTLKNTTHIFNSLKYVTNIFPVIIAAYMKDLWNAHDHESMVKSNFEIFLNYLWYFTMFLNSLYSTLWDIQIDWGHNIIDNLRHYKNKRSYLQIGKELNCITMYSLYSINVVLRFFWIFDLLIFNKEQNFFRFQESNNSILVSKNYLSFGFTSIQILELMRRWLWIFLKVDNEYNLSFKSFNQELSDIV